MDRVILKRTSDDGKATIGAFTFLDNNNLISLVSLELSWDDNKKSKSCIPVGIYKVITTYSTKFKEDMWILENVYNRSGIRIHPANYSRQLQGCISLGLKSGDIDNDGILDVISSKYAINKAQKILGKEFELEITY